MSVEELTEPQEEEPPPPTRSCRVCSIEINAASARCPYCRARQFKHQPVLGWRGLLVLAVTVAAAVLITRAVIDAENAGLHFDSYYTSNLSAFVPVGWQNQLLAGPHGTAIAGYANPSSAADTETITATLGASGSPHSRLLALYKKLGDEPGVARGYHGSVTFPGDAVEWTVYYTFDTAFYAAFLFDACGGAIGMNVTLSASSATQLQVLTTVLPGSAEPVCDGPAFSSSDGADHSVPLAPR
jgi:RNA polymerase subunit RPABC4/transcription elongation factor Spt4